MKNIEIKITKSTRYVDFVNGNEKVGNIGENLQSMLVFSFTDEFVNGQARLEYTINGENQYVFMQKVGETYQTPVTSQLAQCNSIDLQLVITEGTDENEIPKFKSNVFYLPFGKSINAEIEQPEETEEWIDIANTKLNQVDNLDVDLENNILTITKKDGTQYSENVKGDKGEKGDAGSIKFIIVNELPIENIDKNTMYLKKIVIEEGQEQEEQNKYEEYIFTENGWELVGTAKVEVDLTDYVKNTDYAGDKKPGLVSVGSEYGLAVASNGHSLVPIVSTYSEYDKKSSWSFISKGTLENIIVGKGLVSNTDYATKTSVGVVKASEGGGIGVSSSGNLFTVQATNKEIDEKSNTFKTIVPSNLDYAVKSVVGGHITLTQAQYDALETKDENTYYYIEEE